ncbi:fungal-specific transcription factor domain-containing protein [Xylaria palmicola]|nr:fungal-specific transcription factor domain-containing protein [Xylaria palmicola]
MEDDQRYHCWECSRRRLVCDSTRPVCRRCLMAGIKCPGYNGIEPSRLKWLAPGRVVSRTPRMNRPSSDTATNREAPLKSRKELTYMIGGVAVPIFESREGGYGYALIQAVEYCTTINTCIYQDLVHICELGPNSHIYLISPTHLQSPIPDYLRLGFVCMTLSHRINRAGRSLQPRDLIESFYHYRGLAIRSLSQDIDVESRRTGDIVIAGIVTLLLLDIQQGASPSWRYHLEGVHRLITLRGGVCALAPSKHLESLLLCFVFVAVIGNTTCSASDLLMTSFHIQQLEVIIEQYGAGLFSFQMCPPSLFAEIIKINHIRMQATRNEPSTTGDLSREAHGILSRISTFPPQQWAESKPSSKLDWVLLGNVYQAAVTLYCISSLQSVSILPVDSSSRLRCATQGRVLQDSLIQTLSSPRTRRFMLWPLVLLGVEAVNCSEATRSFVDEQLSRLGCHIGSCAPLVAKDMLERFWASGETRWDACFDRPYVFSSQLAADISGLLPQP